MASPPIDLPRQSGRRKLVSAYSRDAKKLAQIDFLAHRIGQFDADGVAARHHGDARRERAHRARDIVGETDDARRFDAGRRLQLVERHHRARPRIDDLAAHAEIAEHAFEPRRVLLDLAGAQRRALAGARRRQQIKRRAFGSRPTSGARASPARAACAPAALPPRHRPRPRRRRSASRRRIGETRLDPAARDGGIIARRQRHAFAAAEQPAEPGAEAEQMVLDKAERDPGVVALLAGFVLVLVVVRVVVFVKVLGVAAKDHAGGDAEGCTARQSRARARRRAAPFRRAGCGTAPPAAAAWRRRRRRRARTAAANARCAAGRRRTPRSTPRRASTSSTRRRSWESRRWPSSR